MSKVLLVLLLALVSCKNLRDLADFDFTKFYNDLVSKHNSLRKKHSAGALTKLTAIAKLAQNTADGCKKAKNLVHSGTSYIGKWMGQNLYVSGGKAPTGAEVANSWYSEISDYNFSTGKPKSSSKVTGHFTQLVWIGSKQIGCAVATGEWAGYKPSYFVCCNYFPGGNVSGQYTKNVKKASS